MIKSNVRRIAMAALVAVAAGTFAAPAFAQISANGGSASTVKFETDMIKAYLLAMRQHKPLVVYFYSSATTDPDGGKCKFCTKLEQTVLSSPSFAAFGDDAIYVQVDVSDSNNHPDVVRMIKSLGVEQVPVVSVIDCRIDEMREIGRVTGSMPVEKFMSQFLDLLRGWNRRQVEHPQA
jgi:hypothetical protein